MEEHCCNFFAPVVAHCADCLFVPIESSAGVGTVGAEIVEAIADEVLAAGTEVVETVGLSIPSGSIGLIVVSCSPKHLLW